MNAPADVTDVSTRGRDVVLVDASTVAARLGVARSYVYEHADELGAIRLGSGPRARLRFDLDDVRRRLNSCSVGSESSRMVEPIKPRNRRSMGTTGEWVPIRRRSGPA